MTTTPRLRAPARFPGERPRRAGERLAAWLLTGPAGYVVAILADLAVLLARLGARRMRRAAQVRAAGKNKSL